jgi:hypothetical protein
LKATLEPVSGAQSSTYRVQVALAADAPAGRFQEAVTLQLQGGAAQRLIVPIEGYVSNDITVEPRLVSLGKVARGSTLRRTVIVRGPAEKPFAIRSIQGSAHVTGQTDAASAVTHSVQLEINVGGDAGEWLQERATLLLSDGRTLDIDVLGTVTQTKAKAQPPGEIAP